jgi:hypothetical protein
MATAALKEWAVTCEALAAGEQVVIIRKGGIGEKRFELPHPAFFLFPTYAHQRPELVRPDAALRYAAALRQREDPTRLPLALWAEIHDSFPIRDPAALDAIGDLQILTGDYAHERLRWRRTQPLWAVVLRVARVAAPPVLAVGPEHSGCVSWVGLPDDVVLGTHTPVLDDASFTAAADAVATALAPFALTA